jgi:cephalosporin hydroxylase
MAYDTDKVQGGLIRLYEESFASIRHQPLSYLEVGIHKGGSLLWARDFFDHPDTIIYGIDWKLPQIEDSDRIVMLEGDQRDAAGLRAIANQHGPFDIVIDDGSHRPVETKQTFDAFWPQVKNGGWYIIEDWGVSFSTDPRLAPLKGTTEMVLDLVIQKPTLRYTDLRLLSGDDRGASAWFHKGGV